MEVIQVSSYINEFGTLVGEYKTADGIMYSSYELDFYIEDNNIIIPDYWDKLKHQYAGMAMQGILSNPEAFGKIVSYYEDDDMVNKVIASKSLALATALVEKLKKV